MSKESKRLGLASATFAASIGCDLLKAWSAIQMWIWFIEPWLKIGPPSVVQAWGALVLVTLAKGYDLSDSTSARKAEVETLVEGSWIPVDTVWSIYVVLVGIILTSFLLAFAWGIHLFL